MLIDELTPLFRNKGFVRKVRNSGLDLQTVLVHYSRFLQFQKNGLQNATFKIKDTCRIDNGRIVPYTALANFPKDSSGIVSFIPAAGSSTRYIQPLYDLLRSGENPSGNLDALDKQHWLLPTQLGEKPECLSLENLLTLPKGLFPCVREGHTFLQLKILEQKALGNITKTVCVVPKGATNSFASLLRTFASSEEDVLFMEQGPQLSTLRLERFGTPLNHDGDISFAPAGHGSLIRLFPEIKNHFPDLDILFIRNIDNVIGCKQDNILASQAFLGTHRFVLDCLKTIRQALAQKHLEEAYLQGLRVLERFPLRKLESEEQRFLDSIAQDQEKSLWSILLTLFQTPLWLCRNSLKLLTLFQRPLNFLAQVPNLGKDRGGTPVIIDRPQGTQTICLEIPHMTTEDQELFLNPQIATHFNPVFAAIELVPQLTNYKLDDNPYWIFAEKRWQGHVVYYHESLLYEILGNSEMSNLMFLELPRSIFNPHKTLDDTKGRSLEHWM